MGNLTIISGGPGSGKSTLLENLNNRGYQTFKEIPRILIEKNLREHSEVLPWINLPKFAKLCYEEMMKQKINHQETAFVDRAIGDIMAYLHIGGYNSDEYLIDAVEGYELSVFMLRPQNEIYIQDEVRPHSYEEALQIHNELLKVYISLGFNIIEIPFYDVNDQIAIVEKELGL